MIKTLRLPPLFFWIIGFSLCIIIAVYIRVYPWRVGLSSESHEKASLLVVYNIKQNFAEQILRNNPSTPPSIVDQMATSQLNELMHRDPKRIMSAIDKASQSLARENKTSSPIYLLESDPYYYYNLTENISDTGQIAPVIRKSKYLNPLMNAPNGSWQPFTLHPYIGSWFYKLLYSFNPNIEQMTAVSMIPIILCIFTIILFALICFCMNFSLSASLSGAFIFTLAPIYLKRSALGWFDTDPHNVFFTLLIIGLMLLGMHLVKIRSAVCFGIVYGIAISLFALIWQGWVMMFIVSFGCIIVLMCYGLLSQQSFIWQRVCLSFLGLGWLVAFLVISLLFGVSDFILLFKEGFSELGKFTVKGLDIWPNLFIGVGELKRSTLKDFIQSLGGIWVIAAVFVSSIFIFIKNVLRFNSHRSIEAVLVGSLLIATFILSLGAERFILFSLVPMSLIITMALDFLIHPRWLKPCVCVLVIIITTLSANNIISTTVTPIFNPVWNKALENINANTPSDAIINTWWPPGHFIKAIAKRAVIFDGATLSEGAIGYWFARALLSNEEDKAQGIFRMINTSRNKAVEYLISQGLQTSLAVGLLEQIAALSTADIHVLLSKHMTQHQIQKLLKLTRNTTPHSYLLLYNELIDTNLILSFTGNWDIRKVETINSNPLILAKVPKRGTQDFIDFCWSIAGGQTKTSPPLGLVSNDASQIRFNDNLIIDTNTMFATINSPTYGRGQPKSVVFSDGINIIEKMNPSANLNYSVVLYKEQSQLNARLMDQALANSMLIKLYYYDGKGLKYFKQMNDFEDLSRRTVIKTFKIEWKE